MAATPTYEEQVYRVADLDELTEHPENPRQGDVGAIAASIEANGFYGALTVQKSTGYILGGNHRKKALQALGIRRVPIIERDVDDATALRILLVDNRSADLATYDDPKLLALLIQAAQEDNLAGTGYDGDDIDQMLADANREDMQKIHHGALSERFLVPPFSVLDARQGYWQDRKRMWLDLGIQSELGRGKDLVYNIHSMKQKLSGLSTLTGTSIFDPVLCEVAYRWFAPEAGTVLDPFAGGSVRGVVAATTGRRYTGIDLSGAQLQANREQWQRIKPKLKVTLATVQSTPEVTTDDPHAVTPVERRGAYWFKRDDLFSLNGATGGKARATALMAGGGNSLAAGIVAISSRTSPQNARAARVAQHLGIPCRCHTGIGEWTEEMAEAELAGAEIIRHQPPRLSVLRKRARDDAADRPGWVEIPWGAVGEEAVEAAARQIVNLPGKADGCLRLVVPVGSGATLAGVLRGLHRAGDVRPVLGVIVGADPSEVLDTYAPPGWRDRVTLVESALPFEQHARERRIEGLDLELTYEAKCIPFMQPGDCLWIVGGPARPPEVGPVQHPDPEWQEGDSLEALDDPRMSEAFDLIFTCPPYADLEVYSDDPRDISTLPYDAFLAAYREIIRKAVAALKPDRFAVIVVGEIRGPDGNYRGFVPDTIRAFQDAGAPLYNEAILATAVGSLAARAGRHFENSRKLGKAHQNVLVFCKGDTTAAHAACGLINIPDEALEGLAKDTTDEDD